MRLSCWIGFVSDAALQAGGTVHGIIPSALTGRAAERAVKDLRGGHVNSAGPDEDEGESKEGTGDKVGRGRGGGSGKFVNEVVTTMHEVRPASQSLSLLHPVIQP